MGPAVPARPTSVSIPFTGYYFEIPSIGAIRINTQVRLWWWGGASSYLLASLLAVPDFGYCGPSVPPSDK